MRNVLIIEDNDTMREGMAHTLKKMQLIVKESPNGKDAIDICKHHKIDLVVTDYRMEKMNGLEVLKQLKKISPRTQVIIITAYGTIDLAVEAMKQGAVDFITKPFSHDEFRIKVDKVIQSIEQSDKMDRLTEENVYLREEIDGHFNFGEIIGETEQMKKLYRTIDKVAKTDSSVIIYGESGTGKELVARAIHKASNRSNNPFIRVNCGALAEGVLESELFGHEKGSFTGALKSKKGRFELADRGTIFLDEIGDLPSGTQVKLLRVLQEREFERVGGEETISVDVRVLAATNHNLESLVEEKKFRKDLYYRLYIIPIWLPPLRNRREDIPLLTEFFIKRIGRKIGKPNLSLTEKAFETLCSYHWPGNVRELENILERSAVLSDDDIIQESDLPLSLSASPTKTEIFQDHSHLDLNETLAQIEMETIKKALEKANGIKRKAARLLGIKSSVLYYKLDKYGLN